MFDGGNLLDASVATYAALLAVTAVAVLPGTGGVLPPLAGVAVGVFLVVLAGARSTEAPEVVLDRPAALVGFVPPLGALAWLAVHHSGAAAVALALAAAGIAVLAWAAALAVAHRMGLRAWSAEVEHLASFEAPRPNRGRRVFLGAMLLVFSVGLVVAGAILLAGGTAESIMDVLPAIGGAAAGSAALAAEREVTLTDRGVRVENTVYAWEDLRSYALTEDALVLRRPGWRWRLTFDRAEIDDLDAVVRVLARYLPEDSG